MAKSTAVEQQKPAAPLTFDVSTIALALAGVTVLSAVVIGFVAGVATALLAVVTGALLGAILLVWYSLRSLAGDADVDLAFDAIHHTPTLLDERKRRALRALKDLQQEHDVGKINDADFASLDADYRDQAKEVFREIDASLDPYRAKAEALVKAHLQKRASSRAKVAEDPNVDASRTECPSCQTANDNDAAFCKKCGTKLSTDE